MTFTLEPAAPFAQQLNLLIMKATFGVANEWFFYDGAHNGANVLEQGMSNTWLHENFVAINEKREIFAYFEGQWLRPMDIISGFRTIHFGKQYSRMWVKSIFTYFDYLFINRGCMVFNWTLSLEQEKQIQKKMVDKCPEQLKLDFALWTREAARQLIKQEYAIEMPVRTVGEYLKRWGFTPQRPQRPLRYAYEWCRR
jgi:hypothetical protein